MEEGLIWSSFKPISEGFRVQGWFLPIKNKCGGVLCVLHICCPYRRRELLITLTSLDQLDSNPSNPNPKIRPPFRRHPLSAAVTVDNLHRHRNQPPFFLLRIGEKLARWETTRKRCTRNEVVIGMLCRRNTRWERISANTSSVVEVERKRGMEKMRLCTVCVYMCSDHDHLAVVL